MTTTIRRLPRPTVLLSAGLMAASLTLSGCSGDGETEAYCDTLASAKADIDALEDGDGASLSAAFDAFDQLADEAPEEVADDWAVLQEGVQQIEDAFEEAGLEVDQLDEVMAGNIPEGVDPQKLAQLGNTMQGLDGEEYDAATDAISQHAEAECDITLGD